jgi:hypothetical protein
MSSVGAGNSVTAGVVGAVIAAVALWLLLASARLLLFGGGKQAGPHRPASAQDVSRHGDCTCWLRARGPPEEIPVSPANARRAGDRARGSRSKMLGDFSPATFPRTGR